MNSAGSSEFDVAIAGGGPAGTSAAIRLAKAGLSVVLIEQKTFPRDKLCGEFISPECVGHFLEMEIDLAGTGGVAIEQTIFYTRRGKAVNVPSRWLGASAFGLSRARMDSLLLDRARENGVEIREGSRVLDVLCRDGRVMGVATRTDGRDVPVMASLVIDARGRSRGFGTGLPEQAATKAAKYVAFKTHLTGARTAAGTCEMFVYRGGYGGCLPVEEGLNNLCFIAPAAEVGKLASDPERFLREVVMTNRRAELVLADARPVKRWLAVPIPVYGPRHPAPAPRILAIGDAAAFIDPFTGSGILLALESAKLAAEVILEKGIVNFDAIQAIYQERYARELTSRLEVSSLLRHAASRPIFAATALSLLGASQSFLRRTARATRSPNDIADQRR